MDIVRRIELPTLKRQVETSELVPCERICSALEDNRSRPVPFDCSIYDLEWGVLVRVIRGEARSRAYSFKDIFVAGVGDAVAQRDVDRIPKELESDPARLNNLSRRDLLFPLSDTNVPQLSRAREKLA